MPCSAVTMPFSVGWRFAGVSWAGMKRREFITLLSGTAATWLAAWPAIWPRLARAQNPPPPAPPAQATDTSVGQVATLQGSATVVRGNAPAVALKTADPIFKNDTLETAVNSTL